ncbi:MAG: hypothetical protein EOO11_02390 [Chitinophagaceae bacterium]|nr:MAG: hypothetical protein EOO11_02390 [Chitinophagaceae bacterium]
MDEYEQGGMDPEMRKYLKKVLNTVFVGLFWMFFMILFGLVLGWAVPLRGGPDVFNIIFYVLCAATLAGLIRYYYRLWK